MHSDIDTLERIKILKSLREGSFDVLVGINLLREGLDIPEVSLVAILDADKEGFLRSETALIQTCGRASRNENGRVVMYADRETKSIKNTIEITQKRRKYQEEYNKIHNIIPKTVKRAPIESLEESFNDSKDETKENVNLLYTEKNLSVKDIERKINETEKEMKKAAKELRFEDAANLRDLLRQYQKLEIIS